MSYLLLRLLRSCLPSLRLLRVSAFLALVCSIFALLGARAVLADIGEVGLAAGRQLDRLEDLTHDAEALVVNGGRFRHSVAYTPEAVGKVLDRFEAECEANPGLLAQGLRALPAEAQARIDPKVPRASRNAAIRDESSEGGMLVCFVNARPTTFAEFQRRLERFAEDLDLAGFGDLRYVYASRKGDETRVITLWNDGGLDLGRMFPASGDAAGNDSSLAPRPADSRRTLTAVAQGLPLEVRIYESSRDPQTIDAYYERTLRERGFSVGEHAKADGTTAYVNGAGSQVFVSLASFDGKTFVTITEGRGQLASVSASEESP